MIKFFGGIIVALVLVLGSLVIVDAHHESVSTGTSMTSNMTFGLGAPGDGSVVANTWASSAGLLMFQAKDPDSEIILNCAPHGVQGDVEIYRGPGGAIWMYPQCRWEFSNDDVQYDNNNFALFEFIADKFHNWLFIRGKGGSSPKPFTVMVKVVGVGVVPVYTINVDGTISFHTQVKYEPFQKWR